MSSPNDIVIVGAVRTPVGRFRGALSQVRGDHLGAVVLNALIGRTGVNPEQIDDVIFGCVTQIGEQSANVARTALLSAGWPDSIPGMTIDRKCGSSEVATHIAAGFISAGMAKMVVAGGIESMSRVPMGSNRAIHGEAFGWMVQERADVPSQGEASEHISDRWNLTREDVDRFAVRSHDRAAAAADAGYFDTEIVPVDVASVAEKGAEIGVATLSTDETIRRKEGKKK